MERGCELLWEREYRALLQSVFFREQQVVSLGPDDVKVG